MQPLRFDGRTAIVTGAGGNPSLGRAFALLLAERGANVVVNDIGAGPADAGNLGQASAEATCREIIERGGRAVADTHSVATVEGATAIVQTALEAFGGVDILVNNAAISIPAPFEQITPADVERHIGVNLLGPIWLCQAVWPHMRRAGFGRIVNIASGALTGLSQLAAYAASKGGVFSLTRALAVEGRPHGILVNAVNPGAFTRMIAGQQAEDSQMYQFARAQLPAELVAPAVALLSHHSCTVSGECIEAVGGEVHRMSLCVNQGFHDAALTPESLAANWEAVVAQGGERLVPAGLYDTSNWSLRPYRPAR